MVSLPVTVVVSGLVLGMVVVESTVTTFFPLSGVRVLCELVADAPDAVVVISEVTCPGAYCSPMASADLRMPPAMARRI